MTTTLGLLFSWLHIGLLHCTVAGADPGLTVGGGAKYTARVSACEILCTTPTFDVISAHDMLYEEKVNK